MTTEQGPSKVPIGAYVLDVWPSCGCLSCIGLEHLANRHVCLTCTYSPSLHTACTGVSLCCRLQVAPASCWQEHLGCLGVRMGLPEVCSHSH
jgi:hypothetical protein